MSHLARHIITLALASSILIQAPSTLAAVQEDAAGDEDNALVNLVKKVRSAPYDADFAEMIHESTYHIDTRRDEPVSINAYRARVLARTGLLLRPFRGSHQALDKALNSFDKNVDYHHIVTQLKFILADLEQAQKIQNSALLDITYTNLTKQLQSAQGWVAVEERQKERPIFPPPPKAPKSKTQTPTAPTEFPKRPPLENDEPPEPLSHKANRDLLAQGLGSFFVVTGLGAAAGGAVALRQSVSQHDRSQKPSPVHLSAGISAALGSALLLGGGLRMLVGDVASRHPERATALRRASWALLATAGGLAAGSLTLGIAGKEEFDAERDAILEFDRTPDYEESNRKLRSSATLAALALSPLGAFIGIHSVKLDGREPNQRAQGTPRNIRLVQRGFGIALEARW